MYCGREKDSNSIGIKWLIQLSVFEGFYIVLVFIIEMSPIIGIIVSKGYIGVYKKWVVCGLIIREEIGYCF